MLPSGDACLRLIDTYEVEPADLNSDDDGDIHEDEEDGEEEVEEDDLITDDAIVEEMFRKRPAKKFHKIPGTTVAKDDVEAEQVDELADDFNIFDRANSKGKKSKDTDGEMIQT